MKEDEQRKKTFNGLTAKEWTIASRNVWNDVSSPRNNFHKEHGATYPQKLAERLIKMYSREGDIVFDPFLGTGSTLLAARALKRNGIGIELVPRFAEISKKQLGQKTLNMKTTQKVILNDCRNMKKHIKNNSIQLMITSPPYANFIHKSVEDRKKTHKKSLIVKDNKSVVKPYSDDVRDFGNLNYEQFMKELKEIMKSCFDATKPGGYNVWVIKDYRDTKNGQPYIDFHTDLANVGKEVGFYYHDLIVWDQNDQRSLVLLGYPSIFYTNQNCSFLVVLRKPGVNGAK